MNVAVEIANDVLNDWLSREGKVVYNKAFGVNWWRADVERGDGSKIGQQDNDNFQAILVCMKPIEKKKCVEHSVVIDSGLKGWSCANCGVKLKPTWTEIEGD